MKLTSNKSSVSLLSIADFSVSQLPEVFRIEPASACNLKCIHCPTGIDRSSKRGVMSEETFGIVLRNLDKVKPKVVVMYNGGKLFLNKNIFKWIGVIKSMGIGFVKTVNNGMLLTEEMLTRIVESGLDSIEFSIDGQSSEENNAIRIGSDHDKLVDIIKGLVGIKSEKNSDTPSIFVTNTQFVDSERSIQTDSFPLPRNSFQTTLLVSMKGKWLSKALGHIIGQG